MTLDKLCNWYQNKHAEFNEINTPLQSKSIHAINDLAEKILAPLEAKFGKITISYGFTSFKLLSYIRQHSPGDMAPELDQHAAFELNSQGNRICKRDGAACDIYIKGYENQMHVIAEYVINELPFDRLYFYGSNRPIHLSFGPDNKRYLHVKQRDKNGKRNVGRGATAEKARALLQSVI